MTREEALPIARSIAAGAFAMNGSHEEYCRYMREGHYDSDPAVLAAIAALTISPEHLRARLAETRAQLSNDTEVAA